MWQPEKSVFKSREVSEIIGLSRRQIQHWGRTCLVQPSYRTPGGHARYSFQDLIAFKTAKKLLQKGISLQKIRQTIGKLQKLLPTVRRPLAELTLVTTGDVVLVFHEGTVFDAISGQEWIIEVAEVKQAVDRWKRRVEDLETGHEPSAEPSAFRAFTLS